VKDELIPCSQYVSPSPVFQILYLYLCSSVVGRSSVKAESGVVTDMKASTDAVWVTTRGGHLLGFHPFSADVLTVHHKAASLDLVLSLSDSRLITFGSGFIGEENGDDAIATAKFSIWDSYLNS